MKTPKIVNAMNHIDDELIVKASGNSRKGKPVWVKVMAMAAAILLVVTGAFGIARMGGDRVAAVVALDVNPSIEIRIGKDERVIDVTALNADAERVLDGMELEKVDINVAVNAVIGSMLRHGYISVERNSILVSVDSGDTAMAESLQTAITEDISAVLSAVNIQPSVIFQRYENDGGNAKLAEDNRISEAQAALIDKVVDAGVTDSNGNLYTYTALAKLTVNELKMILESKNTEVKGISSSGTAQNTSYIGYEKAVEIALSHAGVTGTDTYFDMETELDFDNGVMVYDVEFDTVQFEFDYEINAATGAVVKSQKKAQDDFADRPHTTPADTVPVDTAVSEDTAPPAAYITSDAALSAALTHAGLARSDVFGVEVKLDLDGGLMVYEVEFETREYEYDYEINASAGTVIKSERERQDD